jgi:hypothetical protein
MTPSLWLRDIASLAIQLTFVVCAGAAAFYVLRIRDARISLMYWRGLLLLCLLLPVCQGRTVVPPAPAETSAAQAAPAEVAGVAVAGREVITPSMRLVAALPQAVLWCLAAGALARSAWLAVGARRLRSRWSGCRRKRSPKFWPTPVSALVTR